MGLPKEIESNVWLKNWSYTWSVTFASLYQLYATDFKSYLGRNLRMTMLICDKQVSANYVSKNDLDEFCASLVGLVVKDRKLAGKWIEDTLRTSDDLIDVVKAIKTEKFLTVDNLIKLKQLFYRHIPPHFALKKVVDYLSGSLQVKLELPFREVRIKTENLFNQVDEGLRVYTDFISRKTGLSVKETSCLLIAEAQDYFEKGLLPSKIQLSERAQGAVLFYKDDNVFILSGRDYFDVQKVLFDISSVEVHGAMAYSGSTTGYARIVFDPAKVKVFNAGDILVTGMTRPEFLPLMKKAGAFVTDAGGILSHAAILARELKKPAVIGTQIATKVLKDGDLVEVDANKGVVRILKKAES